MYLKSLELQGFKSFPDKTAFHFGRGITAIVGPNGSGKSNVSDAIRWVLGEQSTRMLRGARMEDVIFGGTQSRSPVGFAEVSLIIDNSESFLPLETNEVMVTRRYFRSGESEYYINGSSVRLKDIHELFMDTGLGRDGYSIIGQGRIDEILSLKSEDRRQIFEEAAGISKYRYRKEEAERKLENTEQNLLRINDKIAELELSVGPLEKQSEKARQYLLYRDELRGLEISVWLENLETLKKNLTEVTSGYENVCRELESEQAALQALYAESEGLAERMREKDIETERKRAELEACEKLAAGAEAALKVQEVSLKNLDENIERIKNELTEHSGRASGIESQIAERRARIGELEAGREAAEAALREKLEESDRLAASATERGARIDALRVKGETLEAGAAEIKIRRSSLEASKTALTGRLGAIGADLAEKERNAKELDAALGASATALEEAREQAESLKNVIDGYELRLQSRQKRLDAAKDAEMKLRMEQNALDSRIRLLGDMEREYEGFSKAVKVVMQAEERRELAGIRGPLSKLIKADDRYAVAVETALGPALQNIVVDTEEDGKAAIEYLKRRDGGRATFLPLTALRGRALDERLAGERGFVGIASDLVETGREYGEIVLNLLGRCAVCDDMTSAIAMAKKHGQRFRIVTLDGQVINAGGSMTGGSLSKGTGILSRANELEGLKGTKEAADAKLRTLQAELSELQREVTARSYETEVARADKRQADDAVLRLEGELKSLELQRETQRAAEEQLFAERADIGRRVGEGEEEDGRLLERLKALEEDAAKVRAEIEARRQDSTELAERGGALSEEVSRLRAEISSIASERQTLKSGLEQLEKLLGEFSADVGEREKLLSDYGLRRADILAESERQRAERERAAGECAARRGEIAVLGEEKLGLERDRTKAERLSQDKNRTILNLERERSRFEQKKTEAELAEKQLVDKLWDGYGLTRTEAMAVRTPVESMAKANRRIAELKRVLSELGEVNLGAIEEFKRVSERYEYLSGQRDDVRSAKDELERIIGEITERMRGIFAERFKEINESFSKTFVEIFGGGSARLELEDTGDILECGIEIKVQPPGKQLKTITLLSGGEKAFVAIALYFAILKVRPTPFCVMDEIEAALDDVNVARFAEYLRTLSDRTQFIVITHRRGTMEESDVLYGVTMQVQGISRVLAINIAEAERDLNIKMN